MTGFRQIQYVGNMRYHFFFNKNYYLIALKEYRYEHECPVQNKNLEQKAGSSGSKCQISSLHFGNILTTVTIRKKFTACKIGHLVCMTLWRGYKVCNNQPYRLC